MGKSLVSCFFDSRCSVSVCLCVTTAMPSAMHWLNTFLFKLYCVCLGVYSRVGGWADTAVRAGDEGRAGAQCPQQSSSVCVCVCLGVYSRVGGWADTAVRAGDEGRSRTHRGPLLDNTHRRPGTRPRRRLEGEIQRRLPRPRRTRQVPAVTSPAPNRPTSLPAWIDTQRPSLQDILDDLS